MKVNVNKTGSCIKWAGGKSWVAGKVWNVYKNHQDKRMVELFAGGLGVSFSINPKRVLEQYDIDATNFCLARAICGDKSDNLDGVSGIGLATAAKRLPILKDKKNLLISDIMQYCISVESDVKIYKNIFVHTYLYIYTHIYIYTLIYIIIL